MVQCVNRNQGRCHGHLVVAVALKGLGGQGLAILGDRYPLADRLIAWFVWNLAGTGCEHPNRRKRDQSRRVERKQKPPEGTRLHADVVPYGPPADRIAMQ